MGSFVNRSLSIRPTTTLHVPHVCHSSLPLCSILSSAERRVRENLISINKCIRAPPKSISILYCRRLLILLIPRCISGKKRRYIHYILDYEWWECEVGYPMWTLGGGLVKYRKALRESCCHLWGIEIANMTSFLKRIVDIPLIFSSADRFPACACARRTGAQVQHCRFEVSSSPINGLIYQNCILDQRIFKDLSIVPRR